MNRGHSPPDDAVIKLLKAGDLRHPWTNEPENATKTKDRPSQAQGQGKARRRTEHHRPDTRPRPSPTTPHTPTKSTPYL